VRSGELAQRTGVSTDTLRHYERLRLLPMPPRTQGGYRDYPERAAERVRLIRNALSLGFSLAEVTEILTIRDAGGAPCRKTVAIARTRVRQLDVHIRELLGARKQLQRVLRDWDRRLAKSRGEMPAKLLENAAHNLSGGKALFVAQLRRGRGTKT
jgi:MerR family transcriptional regulator, copper efflux regulator